MADIKTLLKEARKHIDDKNYREAQECCKSVLRKDKQNYLALVLLGKSLQESDQAPLAYQKAISLKPDNPLAWQGLAFYYERKVDNESKKKLIHIYDEILKLQIEEEKTLEIITKLGQLGRTLTSSEPLCILSIFLNGNAEEKLKTVAQNELVESLKVEIQLERKDQSVILESIQKIYEKEPNETLELLIGKYKLQSKEFTSTAIDVIKLPFFSKNVVLREYLCKYLCKKFVEMDSFENFPIENYIEIITAGIENSKYPGLLRSMVFYNNGLFVEAYKQCVPLINYHEADFTEAVFIIQCTIKLKKWSITQKFAMNFLTKTKDRALIIRLKVFLFMSLANQLKFRQSLDIAKEIPLQSLNIDEQALLAQCKIEVGDPTEDIIQNLVSTKYYIRLQALIFFKQKKYTEIISLLENSCDDAINHFYLGKAYWKLKQYDKCLINLLKTAKMDSDNPSVFLYLGHFYYYHKNDLEKAKKCYEKAYNLNNMDQEIVQNLSEVYTKLQLKENDYELLLEAQKNLPINVTWLSFRLGLHYLNQRDWENAIMQFRNVIKVNHNDVTAFECLADAYYSRGSYTSALRAYNKVMDLDSNKRAHCLTQIGNIYSILTQYENAIITFEQVLKYDPSSLLAKKGAAETWIRIAKKKESSKLYGSARDSAQQAVNYLNMALIQERKFLCLWKLMADSLMFITKLPDKYSFVYIGIESNKERVRKEKLDIFVHAISCYSYIAKQKHQISSYELAAAYLDYYHETKKTAHCNLAFNLIISCIKDKPLVWRNWNLLGKICFFLRKYDIAQHCLIKALLVTRKWSVTKVWCNLGTLYLKLKLFKLANYCFWRGQSTLPSYPQSWIGQALIAEEIREEESMDLFRHSSRLGYHPESALGYADWVCRTIKNQDYKEDPELKYVVDGLHAIHYAMDLVEWYSNFQPRDACACNIMGILQERSGLLNAALKSYESALKFAQDEKRNLCLLNIGRVLVRLERFEDAIKVYKAITEASLNSTAGLALALFKNGLYEESYSVYDTALHWLSNDDVEKADLLVAMAGIVYMFKGADDAKTLLFHSIQISQDHPTAYSLFSICSLGLIHSDQSLSKLAAGELQKFEKDGKYGFDTGFLKSYLHVKQDRLGDAVKILSDSLHDHPSNTSLWFCMAQYLLKGSAAKASAASSCAQRALCSARYNDDKSDSAKIIATASIAEYIAGDHVKAFSLAKEGVHMFPSHLGIWAALLATLPKNMWSEKKDWIRNAISYIRRHSDVTRPLSKWANHFEKKILAAS